MTETKTAITTDRRMALLEKLCAIALADTSAPISLRQFAIQAGVSEPTLRHHFGDRRGVVMAILKFAANQADDFIERCAAPGADLASSVRDYLDLAMEGVSNPVFARIHAFGLVEAIHDSEIAAVYLETAVEPSLSAIERRLAPSIDPDNTDPDTVRHTAFFLYAPLLAAILHQRLLRGDAVRPLDTSRFLDRLAGLLTAGAQPRA